MIKKLITIIMVFIVVVVSGCGKSENNTITPTKLTERENAILETLAGKSFAFDYKAKDYKEVTIWLEKYELGEKVDEKLGWMMTTIEENGTIIFTTSRKTEEQNLQSFNLGVLSDNGSASTTGSENFPDDQPNMMSTWSGIDHSMAIDGETVLAVIAYSDAEHGMRGITTSFFEDPDNHMSDLEEYDVAYLLKVEFK